MRRDLIERLRAHAEGRHGMRMQITGAEKIAGLLTEKNGLLREAAAALEAEASEGERRGLEPTDAMVACFSDPMLNPEWVRRRLRAALALIPAPAREGE